MKRKAEIVILSVMAIFWLAAGTIAAQKVYWEVTDEECSIQPVLVPVVLDEDCKPNVMLRLCGEASDSFDVNCSGLFEPSVVIQKG